MDLTLVYALAAFLGLAGALWLLLWPRDDTWRLEDEESYEVNLFMGWRRRK